MLQLQQIRTHGKGIPIREEGTRNKKGHIARDCKGKLTMKKRKVQEEESDEEDKDNKEKDFGDDLE